MTNSLPKLRKNLKNIFFVSNVSRFTCKSQPRSKSWKVERENKNIEIKKLILKYLKQKINLQMVAENLNNDPTGELELTASGEIYWLIRNYSQW